VVFTSYQYHRLFYKHHIAIHKFVKQYLQCCFSRHFN